MSDLAILMLRREPQYRRDAFVNGLKRCGYGVDLDPRYAFLRPNSERDLLILWNKKAGSEELAANEWERRGGTVLIAENGYLGNAPKHVEYYALSAHGHNGSGWYPWPDEPRFARLGIALKPYAPRPEGCWLVCGQRGIGSTLMASPPGWGEKTYEKLKKAGMNARFRQHPGNFVPKVPLKDDLAGARICVIWSSAAGITALCEGVNVQYSAPHWIASTARMDVKGYDNRLEVFERVAWGQHHVDDIATGAPFERFLQCLRDPKLRRT